MKAMRNLSEAARQIDTSARAFVYEMESKQYDGRMPQEVAERIYLSRAHELVVQRVNEELAPYRKFAVERLSISLIPTTADDLPEELKAVMNEIMTKWRGVFEELTGNSPG